MIRLNLLILLFFGVKQAFAQETVSIENSIVIKHPIESLCKFVTNPLNDHIWRDEVNSMTASEDQIKEGVVYTEDAWIGIRRNFITITKLVSYRCPDFATFITTKENPFYLKSHRSFLAIDAEVTEFTYKVDFDVRMIKETFGLNVSPKVVKRLYSIRMKAYLRKLKKFIEAQ